MNHYERLGIDRGSTAKEIQKGYRSQAKKWHPDMNKDEGAIEQFKAVQEAYEVLSDSHKKFLYDQKLPKPKPQTKSKPKRKNTKLEPIDYTQDPNLGKFSKAEAPLFDIWGNRLTPEQRKRWEQEAKEPFETSIKKSNRKKGWEVADSEPKLLFDDDHDDEFWSLNQPHIR